jgi:hypothetical protein
MKTLVWGIVGMRQLCCISTHVFVACISVVRPNRSVFAWDCHLPKSSAIENDFVMAAAIESFQPAQIPRHSRHAVYIYIYQAVKSLFKF